jgi:MFS family permease
LKGRIAMSRPFRMPRGTHRGRAALRPAVAHGRRLRAALNPIDGVPHPFPQRRSTFADGDAATPAQERAMRNLWWDGFFAEGAEVIWLQYLALYALALGAETWLIGVLAAVSNLLAAVSMWPGAVVAERTRRYKLIVMVTSGGLGRLALLLLAVIPWISTGDVGLGLLVLAAGMRGFLNSVAMPAWNAFAAEFVPAGLRGRYFASRNFGRHVATLATAPLVGYVIYRLGGMAGWQMAWLIALGASIASSAFYLRIPNEAGRAAEVTKTAPRASTGSTWRDSRLLWFVGTSSFFQLSVMIAGPFFSVYFVRELGASTLWVGITAAMMPLAGIVSQPLLGRLNDQLGPKWLLVASGLTLPVAPWFWIIATEPWHIVFVNLIAGVLWSANLLATLNLVLAIAPPEKRPSYSGLQQAGIFFASFLGPLLGGFLISAAGFQIVFFLSGAGRGLATLLLWRFVDEEEAGSEMGSAEPSLAAEAAGG